MATRRAPGRSKTKRTDGPAEVVPFIKVCDDGSYEVCNDAVEFLESLPSPLGIMAMVGPYRTGKSTLLNRCILQEQVFTVGSTIRACTKGILLVKKVLDGPIMENGKPLPVIVIDTEGLGSMDATNTHDTRIFSMALLLSSLFIYNSVGAIDENALSNLSLVTNICKLLRLDKSEDEEPELTPSAASTRATVLQNAEDLGRQAFPPLLWLVRDFTLQLVDAAGSTISPHQYLEQSLGPLDVHAGGISGNLQEKNDIRACIRNCFPLRHCITMVRPVNDETQLQQMSQGINVRVRQLFEEQMQYVRAFVFTNVKPKKVMDIPTTGKGIVAYAKTLVQSINNGSHPVIRDAWTMITDTQCRDAHDSAKAKYFELINELFTTSVQNSGTSGELTWDDIVDHALDYFKKQPMPTGSVQNKYLKELTDFFESDKKRIEQQTLQMSESHIATRLGDLDHFVLQSASSGSADLNQLQLLQNALTETIQETTDTLLSSSDTDFMTRSVSSTLVRLNQRSAIWIQQLYSQSQQLRSHASALDLELRANNRKMEELELIASAANNHEKEQEQYDEMHQKLTAENETILQRATQAEAQAEDLEEAHAQLKISAEAMAEKLKELEQLYSSLRESTEKAKLENATLSSQRATDLTDAVQDAQQSERQKYLTQLQAMKQELDGRVRVLEQDFHQQMEIMQQEVSAAQTSVTQHEAVRKQLLETLADLRNDLRDIQQERLTEQLNWSKKVAEAEKTVVTVSAQKRRLEDKIDPTLPKRLKTSESECASLRSELQFKTHEVTRLEKESQDARSSSHKWEQKYHDDRCKHMEEMMRVVCEKAVPSSGTGRLFK